MSATLRTCLERLVPKQIRTGPPWVHALINQFAWPGLGTLIAGRSFGLTQTLLSLAGFCCIIAFFAGGFLALAHSLADGVELASVTRGPYARWGWIGLILFGTAWIWSLGSSLWMLGSKRPPPMPPLPPPLPNRPMDPD